MEIKKEDAGESIPDGTPYIKDKSGKKLIPIDLDSKEFILIKDDRVGTEIQLISSTQTMDELVLTALTLKLNFFDKKSEEKTEYIN